LNQETNSKHKPYDEAFKQSTVEHWMINSKSARQVGGGTEDQRAKLAQVEEEVQCPAVRSGGGHTGSAASSPS